MSSDKSTMNAEDRYSSVGRFAVRPAAGHHRNPACCKKCRRTTCKSAAGESSNDSHIGSCDQHAMSTGVKRRKMNQSDSHHGQARPLAPYSPSDDAAQYRRDTPYLLTSSASADGSPTIAPGHSGCWTLAHASDSPQLSIDWCDGSTDYSDPIGSREFGIDRSTNSSKDRNFTTLSIRAGDRGGAAAGVPTLLDLAARRAAAHYGAFDIDRRLNGRVPEPAQRRLLFWAFPRDESRVRLYSSSDGGVGDYYSSSRKPDTGSRANSSERNRQFCSRTCELSSQRRRASQGDRSDDDVVDDAPSSSSSPSSFAEGRRCFEANCVTDVMQIGYVLNGLVRPIKSSGPEDRPAHVSLSFDRCRITSVTCSCDHRDIYWCHHAVALALFRIRLPYSVEYRYSLSDSLLQLNRDQLQKLVQYLLAKSDRCTDILPIAQQIVDDLSYKDSIINRLPGAPDPTMGCRSDLALWHFDENIARNRIKLYLIHTFRHEELMSIFSKVREMLRQRDENGPKLLRLITEEFLCSLSCAGSSNRSFLSASVITAGSSGSCSGQTRSQHEKFQQLWDQISALWVCVVLNPYALNNNKKEWHELLKSWMLLPLCPTESSFSLPSSTFCDVHAYRIYGCSDKSIFLPALQASQISWQNPFLNALLSDESFGESQLPHHWPESVPVTCARVESLRANGYREKALKLAVYLCRTVTKFDGSDQSKNHRNSPFWVSVGKSHSSEPWIGHPLDPVNTLYDCLLDGSKTRPGSDWSRSDFNDDLAFSDDCRNCGNSVLTSSDYLACLAIDWALVACLKPRRATSCRYWKEKSARQEDDLLAKLKKLNIQNNGALFSIVKQRALHLLDRISSHSPEPLASNTYIPLHSAAKFLFHVFLHKEPDLAYKIGLEAFKNPIDEDASSDKILIAPLLNWSSNQCCDSSEIRHKQSSLASSLIIAAKDDSKRLALVLNAIRQNAKNAALIYHLAYDIYNESLNHAEGSKSRANMLKIAFELGLQVLKTPSSQPNWCRPSVVRWVVNCATSLNLDSVLFLIRHWADYFTPHESVSVLARVAWSETVNVQLKLHLDHRTMLSYYVQQMALECATKSPAECSLHAISICKNNDANFEAAFRIAAEAGERRTLNPEDLFSIAQHLERLILVEKAYQLALIALANLQLGHADDSHPSSSGIYWCCGLSKTLGRLQLGHVIGYLCKNVRSPVILTNALKLCILPISHHHVLSQPRFLDKQQVSWATAQNALHSQPYLQALLEAAITAYIESVPSRLNHISPRHYCEFIDFLHKARDVFSLTENGDRQFAHFIEHMKISYKGKKKLVALITQKIG